MHNYDIIEGTPEGDIYYKIHDEISAKCHGDQMLAYAHASITRLLFADAMAGKGRGSSLRLEDERLILEWFRCAIANDEPWTRKNKLAIARLNKIVSLGELKAEAIKGALFSRIGSTCLVRDNETLFDLDPAGDAYFVDITKGDALSREQAAMQHDFSSWRTGKLKLLSLRDGRGHRRASIEIARDTLYQALGPLRRPLDYQTSQAVLDLVERHNLIFAAPACHLNMIMTDVGSLHDVARIPQGTKTLGDLNLAGTTAMSLPDNLTVNGDLILKGSQVSTLPQNLTVLGSLDLRTTTIVSLPDKMTVLRTLNIEDTDIRSIPSGVRYADLRSTGSAFTRGRTLHR